MVISSRQWKYFKISMENWKFPHFSFFKIYQIFFQSSSIKFSQLVLAPLTWHRHTELDIIYSLDLVLNSMLMLMTMWASIEHHRHNGAIIYVNCFLWSYSTLSLVLSNIYIHFITMRFFLMTQQANHPLIRMSLVSSNVMTWDEEDLINIFRCSHFRQPE